MPAFLFYFGVTFLSNLLVIDNIKMVNSTHRLTKRFYYYIDYKSSTKAVLFA